MFNDFILALELMSAAIKNDTSINGMKINNSEYLLSQYADDSSLILDGCDDSLRKSLYILEKILRMCRTKSKFRKKMKPYGLGQRYIQNKDYCWETN